MIIRFSATIKRRHFVTIVIERANHYLILKKIYYKLQCHILIIDVAQHTSPYHYNRFRMLSNSNQLLTARCPNGCTSKRDVSADLKCGFGELKNLILMIIHSRDGVNLDRVSFQQLY